MKVFASMNPLQRMADPIVGGGHRVVFLSSDDEDVTVPVAALAQQLGHRSLSSMTRVE